MSQPKPVPEGNETSGGGDVVELQRLLESARDSLTDDMVTRLAATLSGGMDLLDRINRSGVEQALPAISRLVENGDLDRIVEMARLLASAQDSLSEHIVCRLASTVGDGMALLDQINRSGIDRALPAITRLVENGDLDRIVNVVRVLSSAADALSEDIVSRLAGMVTEGMSILDRHARNEGLLRLLCVLERKESQDLVVGLAEALVATSQDLANKPPARGGIGGLMKTAKRPDTQEGMQILALLGKHLSASWRGGTDTSQ